MPGRVSDGDIDVQVGVLDGVTTLAFVAVALTAAALKPALDEVVDGGATLLVVDIGGVGDVRPEVYDYLAQERAYLREKGGELAIVGSPVDARSSTDLGYREAVPFFDGTENAVTFVKNAAVVRPA